MKKRSFRFLKDSSADITLEITIDKNPAKIEVVNKNLFPDIIVSGYIDKSKNRFVKDSGSGCKTTDWFKVEPVISHFLVMSGTGFNCAVWKFADKDKQVIETKIGMPDVEMPENAAWARVFYFDASKEKPDGEAERIQIEYGLVPTHYVEHNERKIVLSKMKDCTLKIDNGRVVILKDGVYTGLEDKTLCDELNRFVDGDILYYGEDCRVNVLYRRREYKPDEECYGVRWKADGSEPVAERIDAAKGLHFNYLLESDNATPFGNDFDNIYPWSQMRLCCIQVTASGKREIVYAPGWEFIKNARQGNVMVEIPKFYVKHEVKEDYEYLWISAKEQEGFKLSPAFSSDKIYVGTYLSCFDSTKLISKPGKIPGLKKSLAELRKFMSKHYKKCFNLLDISAVIALQELFVVETACVDSRLIFPGVTELPLYTADTQSENYAVASREKSNYILVPDTEVTQRYMPGDNITITDEHEKYWNNARNASRKIVSIEKIYPDKLKIVFSGSPYNVKEHETGICALAPDNGEMQDVQYHTGTKRGRAGHTGFKYREIENLWGAADCILDSTENRDDKVYAYSFGGSWNDGEKAGIFTLRTVCEEDEQRLVNGSRLMLK